MSISLSRYSGDFTDSFSQLQTSKLGINNNGYIPYVDYSRDYTPPPSLTLGHVKPTHTSLSNHLIIGTTASPTITSASIVGITTGSIANGTYSLTRNRPLDRLANGLPSSVSSYPNSLTNSELETCRGLPFAHCKCLSLPHRSFTTEHRSALRCHVRQSLLKADVAVAHHRQHGESSDDPGAATLLGLARQQQQQQLLVVHHDLKHERWQRRGRWWQSEHVNRKPVDDESRRAVYCSRERKNWSFSNACLGDFP